MLTESLAGIELETRVSDKTGSANTDIPPVNLNL